MLVALLSVSAVLRSREEFLRLTYPLEGNYARWPRASTPDPQQVPLRLTGWERELPGSHDLGY